MPCVTSVVWRGRKLFEPTVASFSLLTGLVSCSHLEANVALSVLPNALVHDLDQTRLSMICARVAFLSW